MVPAVAAAKFDQESIYIITGGWGGLGRSIIKWMANRGARHVAVLSRRASSNAAETLIKDLETRGITVTPILCDVGVKKNVLEAIKKLSSKGQIKGLIHEAMFLQVSLKVILFWQTKTN
jgi:NAD(P)-dependent dehydrogenase (short-subunit alcohol dehydrogenase family)